MSWPQKTKLLKELSKKGRSGFSLRIENVKKAPEVQNKRSSESHLPELDELSTVRHFTRLSNLNYSIDSGFYPLGSCTMKYNPRINEKTASIAGFNIHPESPDYLAQGALELMFRLENLLAEISGFSRISLQPCAGAQGEYTGIRMIRACLEKRGDVRKKILIPESAHGTNCATAVICGYEVQSIKAKDNGLIDIKEIDNLSKDGSVAALMITNPNTVGLFENEVEKVNNLLHDRGALIYCDGANLNAVLGISRPGDWGVDVMHFNLHKTFTTPHGGGGPGCGAVGVSKTLVPFLPVPTIEKDVKNSENYSRQWEHNSSIGKVKSYFGHFLMMVRAYTYIRELGADGVKKVGEDAVFIANYVRKRLEGSFEIAFKGPCMHEVVLTDKIQSANGIKTLDIAKRLIDLGYHPPTIYFPLIVSGALMIEPTETETLETVEQFCQKMIQIAKESKEKEAFEKYFKGAPKDMPVGRVNETKAAKDLVLTWKEL